MIQQPLNETIQNVDEKKFTSSYIMNSSTEPVAAQERPNE
jgi:hypothetical protein